MPQQVRTHVRVVRSDNRSWPSMAVAYRELIGTQHELGHSEHMRMRSQIRATGMATDRHGFTWRAMGGLVAEETINWSDFTFGVELELYAPISMEEMKRRVAAIDAGWRVVYDGSLGIGGLAGLEAMEVVSPVLQGEAGILRLRKVMDMIKAVGARVNRNCGMHIHVGVRGMAIPRVRKIAIAFLNAECHFDAVVPQARRSNRYCQSNIALVGGRSSRLQDASSISGIANVVNGGNSPQHYNPYRYYKLNFQSFVHHGTIEFRQHSGTVESEKAAQWVRLVTGFCARAAREEQQQQGARESFEQWVAQCTDEAGVRFMTERRAKFATAARQAA